MIRLLLYSPIYAIILIVFFFSPFFGPKKEKPISVKVPEKLEIEK